MFKYFFRMGIAIAENPKLIVGDIVEKFAARANNT